MPTFTIDQVVGHVMRSSGLDAADAHRAVFATMRALGEVLDPPIATALRLAVPEQMQNMLLTNAQPHRPTAFFERVVAHEGMSPGAAKEHAETVCRVLGAVLDRDLRIRMAKDLDRADLFESPSYPESPLHDSSAPPRSEAHTLATGKPGFEHPIAEAAPTDLAHRQSVARSDNPHEATKLSTARGSTQERTHQTVTTTKR